MYRKKMIIICLIVIAIISTGTLVIEENNVIPKIIDSQMSSDIHQGGTATLSVTVKADQGSGPVTVKPFLKGQYNEYLSIFPQSETIYLNSGQSRIVEFTVYGHAFPYIVASYFDVRASGTYYDHFDESTVFFKGVPSTGPNAPERIVINIIAVDTTGTPLGSSYSIYVPSVDSRQYGEWGGEVPKGNIEVEGEAAYGLIPVNRVIDVTRNNEKFILIYRTESDDTPSQIMYDNVPVPASEADDNSETRLLGNSGSSLSLLLFVSIMCSYLVFSIRKPRSKK
ncbi:hypothetical protein Mpsy_1089 [Methanolobus psychrophilus R15]|nr:hypothetical protein Mpsy_1089 [Methanolobus psychrophilus R15]